MNLQNYSPILSIVMPTKNRCEYAIKSIKSCLRIKNSNFELIVEDNSTDNDLEIEVKRINDPRLRYYHNAAHIDMNANFENAVQKARGEYITVIGDDDAVSNVIVEAANFCKENNIDVMVTSRPSNFYWPDFISKKLGSLMSGKLIIKKYTGKVEYLDPLLKLKQCLKSGMSDYYGLPKLYYGIVKNNILSLLKDSAGCYFPGPSPDMANAIALCFFVKKYCSIDYPLFIPGACRKSGTGLGAQNKHTGRLENWAHLSKKYLINWSSKVPRIFSGYALWAEDAIQALKILGKEEYIEYLNLAYVYAHCFVKHKYYINELRPFIENSKTNLKVKILFELIKYNYQRGLSLLNNLFTFKFRLFSSALVLSNINDIYEASILHDKYISKLDLEQKYSSLGV